MTQLAIALFDLSGGGMMGALTAELAAQMQEAEALDEEIKAQLAKVEFEL